MASTNSHPAVLYWPRREGYERTWVSPSPMMVEEMPAPHSRTCWSMRWPSLDTNHLAVSQIWYVPSAMSAPCSRLTAVADASRSPLSASDTPIGSTTTALAHDAVDATVAARSTGGPGTVALASAMAVARRPAARTDASSRSATAAKPQLDPTRARAPRPLSSRWLTSSMSPLRAFIDS